MIRKLIVGLLLLNFIYFMVDRYMEYQGILQETEDFDRSEDSADQYLDPDIWELDTLETLARARAYTYPY